MRKIRLTENSTHLDSREEKKNDIISNAFWWHTYYSSEFTSENLSACQRKFHFEKMKCTHNQLTINNLYFSLFFAAHSPRESG